MEGPILELRALEEFVASILREGDEIAPDGSPTGNASPPAYSPSTSSSHCAKILNPAEETSGDPTPSSYLNKILNPQPATQASTSGQVKTETSASQPARGSNALEDLLEAAGYNQNPTQKSPSPKREPDRLSIIDLEDEGSPSYSPPPSPTLSIPNLVKPFSTSLKPADPTPDFSSSILLEPSSLSHFHTPPAPPPGTPNWKVDLSTRKGHPLHILHVGPSELAILARCLQLVHKATLKGEECARVIAERHSLAEEMEVAFEQWEEVCESVEENVRIEAEEKKQKMKEEIESGVTHPDDDIEVKGQGNVMAKGRGKGKAKTSTPLYDPDHWFGTGTTDVRDFGRVSSRDGAHAFGYRKVEPGHHRRHDTSSTTTTTTDDRSEYASAVEEVTRFEEEVGGEEITRFEEEVGGQEVNRFEEHVGGNDDGYDAGGNDGSSMDVDVSDDDAADVGAGAGPSATTRADTSPSGIQWEIEMQDLEDCIEEGEIAEDEVEAQLGAQIGAKVEADTEEEKKQLEGSNTATQSTAGKKFFKTASGKMIGLYGEELDL